MDREDREHLIDLVLARMREVLRPCGFRQKGQTFSADRGEVRHLISLQQGRVPKKSEMVKVTVCLGAYVMPLAEATRAAGFWAPEPREAWHCQWQRRLGHYLPRPVDKWWTMSTETGAERVAKEIQRLLADRAFPHLQMLCSTEAVLADWARTGALGSLPPDIRRGLEHMGMETR